MSRKSVKEEKNLYQIARERLGWSREYASEVTGLSTSHLERIESGKIIPKADAVIILARDYSAPELCNYFCTSQCDIGKKIIPVIEKRQLSQIVLKMLASINALESDKRRLVEITADEIIEEGELEDFVMIEKHLEQMSNTINSLKLWIKSTSDAIDEKQLNAVRKQMTV
ncbi:helix-turn-helix transcriptional regulator [Eubacterium sp. AB3007]|uniref:helix-turn-helix transcriptional regulator n=1 Tax=Eubacterium sp. AB3007 TaxID=1392487 RepID=UPI00048434D7|nr:helix-turn-helix transcriptional regulator [Eubacterium sp. AB3007]